MSESLVEEARRRLANRPRPLLPVRFPEQSATEPINPTPNDYHPRGVTW